MKVLITGANGLLGQKLIDLLSSKKDIQLITTGRGKSLAVLRTGQYYTMDITDANEIAKVFSATTPDVVIHGAAMTHVDDCELKREECWEANVTATAHVIDACKNVNAHLVHVSTDFIFDGTEGPLAEDALPNPVNFYGESKLAAERLIQQTNLRWSILRTVLVYGIAKNLNRSNIVLWVKKNLEEGRSIKVVNDQWRTPTLAEDLAFGCYLAATKKAHGIYNISGKDFLTPYDIAMATADFFQLDKSLITATNSSEFKQPALRPLKTGFIIEKARRELGYEPHSFEQGLALLSQQLSV